MAVTLQVPFNLEFYTFSQLAGDMSSGQTLVVVREGDGPGAGTELALVPDAIHLLRGCELALNDPPLRAGDDIFGCPAGYAARVYREDGSLARSGNLPREGETISLFAFGLGVTQPQAESGRPPSAPIPVGVRRISYALGANLPPGDAVLQPEFVGLSTGGVGLYQINLRVPRLPTDLQPCRIQTGVNWNFAVQVNRFSTDWVGICVDPSSRAPD